MEILSLGEKIKRRRKELKMTLKDLAGDRITPGQISLVESGKSNPSMDLLEYLAHSLNTSIEYLMESEDTQAEKICKYYENIAESHVLNNNLIIAEQYVEKACYYSEKYSLEYRKAKNLYLRGLIYMHKGELPVAQQFLLSSNVIFIKNNNYEEIVNTFVNLGKLTIELKAYHSSCSYFQQAEKVYIDNDIGNDSLLAEIYYHIAFNYFKLDNVNKAIDYSYLAKEKFKQLNNQKEYANSLLLLSEEYSKKGNMDKAIKYSVKTLDTFKEIDDVNYTAKIENSLGKLFYEFDNLEESFIHFNRAKKIRENSKDPLIIETLVNICENHIKEKNIDKCKKTLDDILSSLENGDKGSLIYYYLLKYRVDMLEGDINEAENTLLMALNFVKNMDDKQKMGEISITIGKFYIDNGRDKEAAKYLNYGVDMFNKIGIIKDM
ncbi:helix-turn-helix transcriptional regulator [Clostridium oceanicum]|uniref:Helix-turn-helix transcriptional regulator n=1 Tax=Clostridium oceanicum TaxID=1543 RepID=A0ABN1JRV6_9CLOT